jgi:TolB protein
MRSIAYTILIAVLLVGFVQVAKGWEEFPVRASTDDQGQPDVSGTIVAWHQLIAEYGDYDILVADVNQAAEPFFLMIGDANDQMNPAVYDDIVVWQDHIVQGGSVDWDVRGADFTDRGQPQFFAVTAVIDNDEQWPAISGSTVVWEDGLDTALDIYGADITDLTSPLEFPIGVFEATQQRPAIYRTTVVWEEQFGVAAFEHDQRNPAVSGNIVVWQDDYFGDWDIFAADISDPNDPTDFAIAATEVSQTNPDIDGNIIVWQDDRHGNWDIFGYNLTTGAEFQITDDRNDQTRPAISGNIVVWEDNRDGHPQIYAVVLDGPAIAQCTSPIPGDVNGDCAVNFADFALMASYWLECRLDPQEACPPL